ncbi:Imm26 family immunity protein [Ammonicoccus fulvus]|uniref:Imm26 family immunity protein n=1 Tax=Ammonicoccus fulvus TaxID=3138240 RepID=A0ABZ3FN51_9ACTN
MSESTTEAAEAMIDSVLGDYHFNTEYRTDVYAEQRGLEQMLYDRYPERGHRTAASTRSAGSVRPIPISTSTCSQLSTSSNGWAGAEMAKINDREGDWFAVPLRKGGYAVGLIARANRDGVLLGYFFGPRREAVPSLSDVEELTPDDAIRVGKFGHLGLKQAQVADPRAPPRSGSAGLADAGVHPLRGTERPIVHGLLRRRSEQAGRRGGDSSWRGRGDTSR